MVLDVVKRIVVSSVTLVLPNVDCETCKLPTCHVFRVASHTESVTVADFSSPTSNEVNLILRHVGHAGIPRTNKVDILVHLVRLDVVEDDAVHVLASCKDLTEAAFNLSVHLLGFGCAVYQRGQATSLLADIMLFARLS